MKDKNVKINKWIAAYGLHRDYLELKKLWFEKYWKKSKFPFEKFEDLEISFRIDR